MNIKNYTPHLSFLLATVLLGNAVITLPFLSTQSSYYDFLACVGFAFVLALVFLPIINNARGIGFYLTATIIILISFYGAVSTFVDYISFLSSNKILSVIALVALVAALTVCSNSAYLKFCLALGVIAAGAILLLFIMPMGEYEFRNINLNTLRFNFKNAIICFLKYFSPVLSVLLFARLCDNKAKIKNTLLGILLWLLLLMLCLLQSVLMLGNSISAYSYPYLAAVSGYSSGQLYIRQDGFVWFIFFAASVIKISLCTKTIWLILKHKKGNQA